MDNTENEFRRLYAFQQVMAQVLSTIIVATGNKEVMADHIQGLSTDDPSMEPDLEEAKAAFLAILDGVEVY